MKFKVIRLRNLIVPMVLIILSTAVTIPVLKTEKADANAIKTVYFTFDDGPSEMTEEILKILSEEKIKATFFVIGPSGEKTDDRLFKIYSEGHTIGLHTMSHSYNKIYTSAYGFLKDLEDEKEWVYSVTGEECNIFRFPGGSNNSLAPKWIINTVKSETEKMGMTYYDWNADGKDSLGSLLSPEDIVKNVLSSEFIDSNEVIVLLHDSSTRTTTPEALRLLIAEFKSRGYAFAKLQ